IIRGEPTMKTPREIIMERHRAAETKLDAIRKEELAALACASAITPKNSFNLSAAFERFWRESIWPWRRVWTGIAAVWLGILALNLAAGGTPQPGSSGMTATKNPEVVTALLEQKKLLAQLLEPVMTSTPPSSKPPGPRSEQRQELFIA
ncbi:MAG TPA: hypothetical protein VG754_13135, partial [Verrucomicrobiae bacterium]|nr:hypothetical protein [Verrucomicrobiae bacterium]